MSDRENLIPQQDNRAPNELRREVDIGRVKRILAIDGLATAATTVTEYNITCTVADTQYSQLLPDGTKRIAFIGRDYAAIRFSFVSGKVATPTAPYGTLAAGQPFDDDGPIDFDTTTLYVASSTAGAVVELLVWT